MNTRLQLNLSTRINPETQKVLEYSVLANVASNSVNELTELYEQLKGALGEQVIITGLPQTLRPAPTQVIKPSPEKMLPQPSEVEPSHCPFCSTPLRKFGAILSKWNRF